MIKLVDDVKEYSQLEWSVHIVVLSVAEKVERSSSMCRERKVDRYSEKLGFDRPKF